MRRVERSLFAGAAVLIAAPAASQPVTLEREGDAFRLGEYVLDIHAPHRPIVEVESGALVVEVAHHVTVGEHEVRIGLPLEILRLCHRCMGRTRFAAGGGCLSLSGGRSSAKAKHLHEAAT
jgi:hypothetical protein